MPLLDDVDVVRQLAPCVAALEVRPLVPERRHDAAPILEPLTPPRESPCNDCKPDDDLCDPTTLSMALPSCPVRLGACPNTGGMRLK